MMGYGGTPAYRLLGIGTRKVSTWLSRAGGLRGVGKVDVYGVGSVVDDGGVADDDVFFSCCFRHFLVKVVEAMMGIFIRRHDCAQMSYEGPHLGVQGKSDRVSEKQLRLTIVISYASTVSEDDYEMQHRSVDMVEAPMVIRLCSSSLYDSSYNRNLVLTRKIHLLVSVNDLQLVIGPVTTVEGADKKRYCVKGGLPVQHHLADLFSSACGHVRSVRRVFKPSGLTALSLPSPKISSEGRKESGGHRFLPFILQRNDKLLGPPPKLTTDPPSNTFLTYHSKTSNLPHESSRIQPTFLLLLSPSSHLQVTHGLQLKGSLPPPLTLSNPKLTPLTLRQRRPHTR
nr:hypothetical protein HmN_000915600 [Hymenolepis microstoma]